MRYASDFEICIIKDEYYIRKRKFFQPNHAEFTQKLETNPKVII